MRRARLLLHASVLAIGLLVIAVGTALAVHYTLLQQDPALRAEATPPANYVVTWWSYGPWDTPWAYDAAFTPDEVQAVQQAVQSWQGAVPQLTFSYSPTPGTYALFFKPGFCGVFADACITRDGRLVNADRGASYWNNADIILARRDWTPLGKADTFRHELGHWIGLHEEYVESPVQCSGIQSVMNTGFQTTGENCLGFHAPTAWEPAAVLP